MLPSTNASGSQQFNITASGNADFQNLLGLGERFNATLEQLKPQSPKLDIRFSYPYILKRPIGADFSFNLYKQDTTYLDAKMEFGLQYLLGGNNYIKGFWNNLSSSNLLINKPLIMATRQLPTNLDVRVNSYGLEYRYQRLDYVYNPRKGWAATIRGSVGTRQILENADILSLKDPNDSAYHFTSLYDTVPLSAYQYKLDAQFQWYIPLLQRSALKLGLTMGGLFSSSLISQNEQYRIGGSKLMRGFDEESLYATRYGVATVEYHFIIGRNAYLYAFADKGYLENTTRLVRLFDRPAGYGAGITFETAVGVFGVSLAVGSQQNASVDFRSIKTHFGYVSLF